MKRFAQYIILTILVFLVYPMHAFAQEKQNVSVSAVILATQNDYDFALATDTSGTITQDSTLTYTISYGAKASGGFDLPTTISVDFSDDIAPTGSHVTDYVIDSASKAYGGTVPIVDSINRTITWNIPNLPAGTTGQTVTFKLRTNKNYTGLTAVSFITQANMSNQYLTMPQQSIAQTYRYALPKPGPVPTSTPSPTPLATPTPTPPAPFGITGVSINAISQNVATIATTTNKPAYTQISYGTSPLQLTQSVNSNQLKTASALDLTNLQPATKYYFRVKVTNASKRYFISELYTFTTANQSPTVDLTNASLFITSGGNVVVSSILIPNTAIPFGTLTTNSDYQVTYSFASPPPIKHIEVLVRNADGIVRTVAMTQQDEKTFIANLHTDGSGIYDIVIQTTDIYGNVTQQKVAQIKVVNRLTVLEKGTSKPIGDARIFLSTYNKVTKNFDPLSEALFGWLKNPSFTDASGQFQATLPDGRYQVQVSALGYDGETVDFTIGEGSGQDFPTIYLQKDMFNVVSIINYVHDWTVDSFNELKTTIIALANSIRLYNSVAALSLTSFSGLTLLLFKIRTGIQLRHLIPFMLLHVFLLMHKHEKFLHGIILSKDKTPLSQVRIEVMDVKTNTVLTHVVSNNNGRFAIRNRFDQQVIKFILTKEGFSEQEMIVETGTRNEISITMKKKRQRVRILVNEFEELLGGLFETILLLSLLAELFFLPTFGLLKTLPFFALSLFNLIVWFFYMREKRLEEK